LLRRNRFRYNGGTGARIAFQGRVTDPALVRQVPMKKLQRYVLKTLLKALMPALSTLTLIMALGVCMQLLHQGLDVVRLDGLLPPVLAYCIPMVFPPAFLTAVILTFGRLSAEGEITAVRAAGIHLMQISYPVLALAVLVSLITALFLFQTVPRARGVIKALKREAIKQVILDRVTLSTRRQFAFPPAYVQYEDVVDGRLERLVVLDMPGGVLRTIITARSGVLQPDPQRPDIILFRMKDCTITGMGGQAASQAGPITAEQVTLPIRVGSSTEATLSKAKYLGLKDFIRRFRSLRAALGGQPALAASERMRQKQYAARERLTRQVEQLDGLLAPLRAEHRERTLNKPRLLRQTIEHDRTLIATANDEIATLEQQQQKLIAQRRRIEQGNPESIASMVELQKKLASLASAISEKRGAIREWEAEIAESERQLALNRRRAEKLRAEIRELEKQRQELSRKVAAHDALLAEMEQQEELESMLNRIHRRLSLAASIVAFTLIGIPLGIVASKRRISAAFAVSFAIVLFGYYPLMIIGDFLAEHRLAPAAPAIWAGDILLSAVGAILMFQVIRR